MLQGYKVSNRQVTIMIMLYTVGSGSLLIPATVLGVAYQDGLFSILMGMAFSVCISYLFHMLVKKYPNKSILDMMEFTFGRWVGGLVQIVFIIIVTLVGAGSLFYDVSNFTRLHILPDTPKIATSLLIGVVVVVALRSGLRTIAIAAELLYPVYIALVTFLILGIIPKIKWEHLFPILHDPFPVVFQGFLMYCSYSVFVLVCFLTIYPRSVQQPQHAFRCFCTGMLYGGTILFVITLACLLVLGVNLTSLLIAPSYVLGKEINIGHFITRLEVVTAAFWYISLFFKLIIYYYAGLMGIAHVCRLKQYKVLIIPLTLVLAIMADTLFKNPIQQFDWNKRVFTFCSILVGLIIPLGIWIVGSLRGPTSPSPSTKQN